MSSHTHDFTAIPVNSPTSDGHVKQHSAYSPASHPARSSSDAQDNASSSSSSRMQRDPEDAGHSAQDRPSSPSRGAVGNGIGSHSTASSARGHGGAQGGAIEMNRLRPVASSSFSASSNSLPSHASSSPPQSLVEALDALAKAQAEVALLQSRLDAATKFSHSGMDHSESGPQQQQQVFDAPGGRLQQHDPEAGLSDDPLPPPRMCCGCIELHTPGDVPPSMSLEQYFATPFYAILFRRLPWLVGLLLLQSFSASILRGYDEYLSTHLLFSFFIPMIVGTGGNAGNQCSVMVTRALALGMDDSQVWRVVKKETPTAILTAITLGFFAFMRVAIEYPHGMLEAAAIAVTLGVSIILSIALGIAFSYGIGMLNRCDPADGAAPLLTTISDLIGIALLCGIATSMVP